MPLETRDQQQEVSLLLLDPSSCYFYLVMMTLLFPLSLSLSLLISSLFTELHVSAPLADGFGWIHACRCFVAGSRRLNHASAGSLIAYGLHCKMDSKKERWSVLGLVIQILKIIQ